VDLLLIGVLCGLFVFSEVPSVRGRSSSNDSPRSVSLYVTILDKKGEPVGKASSQDLTILEENKPQVIKALQFEKDAPVSVGVLIDVSRGMGGEGINLALTWLKIWRRHSEVQMRFS